MVVPMTVEAFVEMYIERHKFEAIRSASEESRKCATLGWIRDSLKDVQLVAAVENLQSVLTGGGWLNNGNEDSGLLTLQAELQQALAGRAELQRRLDLVEQHIVELSGVAKEAGSETLLPEDVDLTDGMVVVKDRMGNVVREFRLEGGNLELALRTIEVEPVDEEVAQP
jgi:hypothetical protein